MYSLIAYKIAFWLKFLLLLGFHLYISLFLDIINVYFPKICSLFYTGYYWK